MRRNPSSRLDPRLPVAELAELAGIDELPVDLACRVAGAADLRLDAGPGQPGDRGDDLEHAVGALAAGVERLPADRVAVEPVGDRQVGGGGVLDVEQVPYRRAVGAEHRRAAFDRRADRLRDQAREVEIAAAVDVGEAGHRHRQSVARPVGAGDQVGGRLRRLVRRGRPQREVLRVGELLVGAVGLVGGGEDDPLDPVLRGMPPASSRCRGRWCRRPRRGRPARCRRSSPRPDGRPCRRRGRPASGRADRRRPASRSPRRRRPRCRSGRASTAGRGASAGRSETTSTPRSSRALQSQAPTNPRPPVTSATLTPSADRRRVPDPPRRRPPVPEVVEQDRVLVGVHAVPEALDGGTRAARRRRRAARAAPRSRTESSPSSASALGSRKRNPALTHCSIRGFSTKPLISSSGPIIATPHCERGRTTVTVAAAPWERWKSSASPRSMSATPSA